MRAKRLLIDREIEKLFPEDVWIEEILLKLPAISLSNLRYVSKYFWNLITNPSFVKLHLHHSIAQPNNHLLLISSHRIVTCMYKDRLRPKNVIHNYACNFTTSSSTAAAIISSPPEIVEMHCPFEHTEIQASCNGLLYLHRRSMIHNHDHDTSRNYIWNPCTREIKELPPSPPPLLLLDLDDDDDVDDDFVPSDGCPFSSSSGFCGFGYVSTNDQYKVLHYENHIYTSYIDDGVFQEVNLVSSIIEFKLHTLGTNNTWRSIDDNPYKSFFFNEPCKRMGLLVNGALHWIMCPSDPTSISTKIISFDMEKEVFGEIQKPPLYYLDKEEVLEEHHYCRESLQVLQECVCICQVHLHGGDVEIDIWMLQDYDVMDSWTKLFRVVIPNEEKHFDYHQFRLLRYCENGEIVMLRNVGDVIVYDPVNHKARCAKKFNETVANSWKYYLDYTESLASLSQFRYLH